MIFLKDVENRLPCLNLDYNFILIKHIINIFFEK